MLQAKASMQENKDWFELKWTSTPKKSLFVKQLQVLITEPLRLATD